MSYFFLDLKDGEGWSPEAVEEGWNPSGDTKWWKDGGESTRIPVSARLLAEEDGTMQADNMQLDNEDRTLYSRARVCVCVTERDD